MKFFSMFKINRLSGIFTYLRKCAQQKNHAALAEADQGESEGNIVYMGQCCLHAHREMRAGRVTAHFQVSADSLHPLPDSRRHQKENKKPHKNCGSEAHNLSSHMCFPNSQIETRSVLICAVESI